MLLSQVPLKFLTLNVSVPLLHIHQASSAHLLYVTTSHSSHCLLIHQKLHTQRMDSCGYEGKDHIMYKKQKLLGVLEKPFMKE